MKQFFSAKTSIQEGIRWIKTKLTPSKNDPVAKIERECQWLVDHFFVKLQEESVQAMLKRHDPARKEAKKVYFSMIKQMQNALDRLEKSASSEQNLQIKIEIIGQIPAERVRLDILRNTTPCKVPECLYKAYHSLHGHDERHDFRAAFCTYLRKEGEKAMAYDRQNAVANAFNRVLEYQDERSRHILRRDLLTHLHRHHGEYGHYQETIRDTIESALQPS